MTEQELERIDERMEKATPGPWEVRGRQVWRLNDHQPHGDCSGHLVVCEISGTDNAALLNLSLIASCRQDVPALVAEVRLLRRLLGDAEEDGKYVGLVQTMRKALEEIVATRPLGAAAGPAAGSTSALERCQAIATATLARLAALTAG